VLSDPALPWRAEQMGTGDGAEMSSGGIASKRVSENRAHPVNKPALVCLAVGSKVDADVSVSVGSRPARWVSSCRRCSIDFVHARKQFLFALSKAGEGRHNPWWEILASKPIN
jgi:hypothetical protein